MFDCCRIPGLEGLDWSVSYAKKGELGNSGHIIVFRYNRPWKIKAAENGRILSTDEFERYNSVICVVVLTYFYADKSNIFMITQQPIARELVCLQLLIAMFGPRSVLPI